MLLVDLQWMLNSKEKMNISQLTNCKYSQNKIDGKFVNHAIEAQYEGNTVYIPINSNNMDYIELMKRVDAGELTIAPADEE